MYAVAWSRSERERYWGPFTWSPEQSSSGWGLNIRSVGKSNGGSEGDEGLSYLRVGLGRRSLIVRTPRWLIPPVKTKHYMTTLREDQLREYTARNGGRDWYWQFWPREYGFFFHEDSLHTHFGVQNLSWGGPGGSKSRVFFYPWLQTRTVREDYYDAEGKFFAHKISWRSDAYEARKQLEATVPVKKFAFKDCDGEIIVASLRLEEREVARGDRRGWRWLSWLVPNKVYRSFDIAFSSEVGPEKGSWKGGIVGHAISSDDRSELHEAAFRRYCAERRAAPRSRHDAEMTFLYEVKQ